MRSHRRTFQRLAGIARDHRRRAVELLVQVLDDDRGLGHVAAADGVVDDRELAQRPNRRERAWSSSLARVDEAFLEGDAALVKRDQHLVAEGRQRVVIQRQRHAASIGRVPAAGRVSLHGTRRGANHEACPLPVRAGPAAPAAAALATAPAHACASDIQHSGDCQPLKPSRSTALLVEADTVAWATRARPIDGQQPCANRFDSRGPGQRKVLYSRGYSTVFGEWRTTDEAAKLRAAFPGIGCASRMPAARRTCAFTGRGRRQCLRAPVGRSPSIPAALVVERESWPAPRAESGYQYKRRSATKVDLLILGGWLHAGGVADRFEEVPRRMAAHLFTVSPFKERAGDFNVWALTVPVPASGVSRPSTGIHRASATGLRYDIFGSERYALDAGQPPLPRPGQLRALRVRRDRVQR
jgi:hypothetical protein